MASFMTKSFQKIVLWHNKFGSADTVRHVPTRADTCCVGSPRAWGCGELGV